jgi:hypothetical protein
LVKKVAGEPDGEVRTLTAIEGQTRGAQLELETPSCLIEQIGNDRRNATL